MKGKIYETGEHCEMACIGYWASNGRKISSYIRIDKVEEMYRQYSMDRHHNFYLETEDPMTDYYEEDILSYGKVKGV